MSSQPRVHVDTYSDCRTMVAVGPDGSYCAWIVPTPAAASKAKTKA